MAVRLLAVNIFTSIFLVEGIQYEPHSGGGEPVPVPSQTSCRVLWTGVTVGTPNIDNRNCDCHASHLVRYLCLPRPYLSAVMCLLVFSWVKGSSDLQHRNIALTKMTCLGKCISKYFEFITFVRWLDANFISLEFETLPPTSIGRIRLHKASAECKNQENTSWCLSS